MNFSTVQKPRSPFPSSSRTPWSIPPDYPSGTAFLLGGGTSLPQQDGIGLLHDPQTRTRILRGGSSVVIAVNRSYRSFPFAEYLLFMDSGFYDLEHGREDFQQFAGRKVSLGYNTRDVPEGVLSVGRGAPTGLSLDPRILAHGSNSGYAAINLAVLLGCTTIVLLGYDMSVGEDGREHHYEEYPSGRHNKTFGYFSGVYLRRFGSLPPILEQLGVRVWNCSPISRLPWWPKTSLLAAMQEISQLPHTTLGVNEACVAGC